MNERVPDPGDPVDVAALAELDAGLPDAAEAAARRRGARADPRAAEVLDALAATRAELAAAGDPEPPPEVAARWAAALAAEPTTQQRRGREAPVRAGRGSSRRRLLLATAAAAAVGVLTPRTAPPALAVSRVDLVAVATSTIGTMDVGDLADPARREACLRAVLPTAAGQRLLGGRRVVLDGQPGVLLVHATGTRGGLHVVTVDPDCGPAGGALLAQVRVG
ncbi:MAG: hypothetical protein ACXW5J_19335 [Thermoanaerobaculia bacterium]